MDMIARLPAELNPSYLDQVLAKSAEQSQDPERPDTLADHTWAVLSRLADQYRLRGSLLDRLGEPRLWHRLYWGCFFHDFGKAASGFQERLRKGKVMNGWSEGRHRHEVLSLAFVDAAFPRGHIDRLPIIGVVIAHHKDFVNESYPNNTIYSKYGGRSRLPQVEFLLSQLDADVTGRLWRWFHDYGEVWARALGFPVEAVEPVQVTNTTVSVDNIRRCLEDFSRYYTAREEHLVTAADLALDIHYRGLILTADHAASAGAPPFPALPLTMDTARRPLTANNRTPNPHQSLAAESAEGSTILIAPTGSGKTEAALLWAARQMTQRPAPRLFYTLPYQASMNAMEARLKRDFFPTNHDGDELVTVQHSRATLKYYRDLMEADGGAEHPKALAAQARQRKDRARLNYYPVQVFSPYQMLKAAFRLKGYEPLMVDYTDALFIFDEIHAYNAERLALMIATMSWLARQYHARFLVMTATLPPMVIDALTAALPGCGLITADAATFEASKRHEVHLRAGDLTEQLDLVMAEWQAGRSVLVCCNTVSRAQQAYINLKTRLTGMNLDPLEHLLLLHGRFNGKDRGDKEEKLLARAGVDAPRAQRKPMIAVATQVVEVSLNIDFDVLYTDPAPLEALLQRFGRVNRGRRERSLCPVYVFTAPVGKTESRPYDDRLVSQSLAVLTDYCGGRAIDEGLVSRMLAEIYEGDIVAAWRKTYDAKAREIAGVLDNLTPYTSASAELEHTFYRLFDGVEVLPLDCYDDWEAAQASEGYLGASRYMVNIGWGQLGRLKSKGQVCEREEDHHFYQVKVHYNSEFGLDLNGQLGSDDNV